jgi:hypothetical protein
VPVSLSVLIAARDEEGTIAGSVAQARASFPEATVVVADDGSCDATAARAREAGALVVSGPRLGKGEALNAAERAAAPGPLLLCDADVQGDLRPLVEAGHDLAIAAFAQHEGGGFGIAKGAAGRLLELRTGRRLREPLSGQRFLSERARAACFPLARGFGCELRMTIDALRAGLDVGEVELPLRHRATGRDVAGFAHRGRQLAEAALAAGPLARNFRGNRLPLVGAAVALGGVGAPRRIGLAVAAIAAVGLVDDLFAGPERGFRDHLRSGRTTGVLKLAAIPAIGALATRSLSGGLVVALSANALNQLDTAPGRALKAFLLGHLLLHRGTTGRFAEVSVVLLPYDLDERVMLGDAGSNALGAVLGLESVARHTSWARWTAVGILAGLNLLGERTSLGALIERAPVLRQVDSLGRWEWRA